MALTPLNFTNLLNNKSAFNDLNEPHLTYDFPASQYHSPFEDYNYEETPTSEVYTNEETPRAPNSKKAQRQAQRQANFTIEEDKLLVSAWLNIGLDPVKGADQKKKQFWKRITDYFEKHKKWSAERSEKSLTNRWSTISSTVSKFCGHYAQIEHLRKSGYTEQDMIVEAKENFKLEEGHAFVLDHCWVVLRFQQKWMDEHQKIESKRKWKAPSSKVADSINLEDDDTEAPEPASLKRPIGRKAAKEAIKKAKSKEQIYKRASSAFGALSSTLVDQMFLYGNRPSSLDAVFLSQALITLQALPETSILRNKLLEHENLVGYANRTKMALLDAGASSSVPNFHANPSSSAPRKGPSNWRSKPMTKTKRGKTKEEDFKRRAKYVFIAQLIAVVLYVTLMDQTDGFDVEDDDEDFDYNE